MGLMRGALQVLRATESRPHSTFSRALRWRAPIARATAPATPAAASTWSIPDVYMVSVERLEGPFGSPTAYHPSKGVARCLCTLPYSSTHVAATGPWNASPYGAGGCRAPPPLRYCCGSSKGARGSSSSSSSRSSDGRAINTGGAGTSSREASPPEVDGMASGSGGTRNGNAGVSSTSDNKGSSSPLSQPEVRGTRDLPVEAASLWRLLSAAVWPTSKALRIRVVAAVASLMAAKCLTIAAPVALAGLVDHFAQTAAVGIATGAAGGATAAGLAGATGPAALIHPALPVGLVISYPLARLGASGNVM